MKTDVSVFVVKMLLKPKLSAARMSVMTPHITENHRHIQQEWANGGFQKNFCSFVTISNLFTHIHWVLL